MGHQIIKQPDGLYAVFSSVVDSWILYDATREDLIGYYAEKAYEDAKRYREDAERYREDAERGTARLLDAIEENPRKAYCQFTMTFEEANAMSVKHGGEDLSGKLASSGNGEQR
jgi:hypothetical protein